MKSLYSIYDRVSDQYLNPEAHENDAVATRAFLTSCANPAIPDLYLDDITLVCVGTFDELTGAVVPVDPRNVFFGNSPAVKELRTKYKEAMRNEIFEEERND